MVNRLAKETSPYLLQHAHNPVDWYPWGEEALVRARREDRPILLSIGYSACHWCHVMERESFEDPETASVMNENFVCIKVDREERPDLDAIYMKAVQTLTGHGGWPMTIFLTPDGKPFYGGTYFPPTERYGMPSFRRVLLEVGKAYRNNKASVNQTAEQLREHLSSNLYSAEEVDLDETILQNAFLKLSDSFDNTHGGFSGPPKFPQAMNLEFLLRVHRRGGYSTALRMVELTLTKMARGGIYDQLGGGFHRYSVDGRWLVPHFEKMLYDNALLSRVYLHAFQITKNPLYRRIIEETLDYVKREMTHQSGGFFSTQDADSEGEEGKFFVWTEQEVTTILGNRGGEVFCKYYDITDRGNFEGKNILNVPIAPEEVARKLDLSMEESNDIVTRGRKKLFEVREQRVKPGRDEKVLAAWNGLMLASFAEASRILNRDDYKRIAEKNADFLLSKMQLNGRLLRTWKDGEAKLNGYLEDYAFLADGLLALYQATFNERWFIEAKHLVEIILAHFVDKPSGGFYDTADDHEQLVTRPKSFEDNAVPSGGAVATKVLLLLSCFTGDDRYRSAAIKGIRAISGMIEKYHGAFGQWLCDIDFYLGPASEVAIIGDIESVATRAMLNVISETYRPNLVVALDASSGRSVNTMPLLANRTMRNGRPTAYVCRSFACRSPLTDPEELRSELEKS